MSDVPNERGQHDDLLPALREQYERLLQRLEANERELRGDAA